MRNQIYIGLPALKGSTLFLCALLLYFSDNWNFFFEILDRAGRFLKMRYTVSLPPGSGLAFFFPFLSDSRQSKGAFPVTLSRDARYDDDERIPDCAEKVPATWCNEHSISHDRRLPLLYSFFFLFKKSKEKREREQFSSIRDWNFFLLLFLDFIYKVIRCRLCKGIERDAAAPSDTGSPDSSD